MHEEARQPRTDNRKWEVRMSPNQKKDIDEKQRQDWGGKG